MTAAVTMVVAELKDSLLVPNQALRFQDGGRVVYVQRNGEFIPVQVKLGATGKDLSQVLEGDLQEDDQVLLNPSEALRGSGLAFRPRMLMHMLR
jgi:multidrug efflux pump subunit AcrA (membrane-fusion protein)